MRDAATHTQLVEELRISAQADPMKHLSEIDGVDPASQNRPADLLERSDVISFNGVSTLVPKRAILSIPEKFKTRLTAGTNTPLVPWSDFLIANRAWITTEEISYQQAAGVETLSEEAMKRIAKSSNLVIATYLGGPISFGAPAPAVAAQPLTH